MLSRPAVGYAAFDVFMGGKADPHLAIDVLKEAFKPASVSVKEHLRTNATTARHVQRLPRRAPVRERARAAA
jgi:S-adenosylmethionine decarboxylase